MFFMQFSMGCTYLETENGPRFWGRPRLCGNMRVRVHDWRQKQTHTHTPPHTAFWISSMHIFYLQTFQKIFYTITITPVPISMCLSPTGKTPPHTHTHPLKIRNKHFKQKYSKIQTFQKYILSKNTLDRNVLWWKGVRP